MDNDRQEDPRRGLRNGSSRFDNWQGLIYLEWQTVRSAGLSSEYELINYCVRVCALVFVFERVWDGGEGWGGYFGVSTSRVMSPLQFTYTNPQPDKLK